MEASIILEAERIRMERDGDSPLDLPDSLPVSILKEAVRTIDVFLQHYRDDKDGSGFRYVKKNMIQKNFLKTREDRRRIMIEAANQLNWILSDEPSEGLGITFREICEAEGTEPEMVRKLMLSSLFGEVHSNALKTLKDYLVWSGEIDVSCDCDTCNKQEETKCRL